MSDATQNQDPVFIEEQDHLKQIYAQLVELKETLSAKLEKDHERAVFDMRELSEELRPDTGGGDDEIMETLAAIETLNAVIDTYNLSHDLEVDKLRRVILLLSQPYFAKVRLKLTPESPSRDVYIGAAGLTDEAHHPLIVDWRNPVAETYYNQENGMTSYTVNGRTKTVELELRRQFDIARDKLNAYFDTTVAIEDPLLLGALKRQHSEKLKDITATIQREQNEVVRHEDVPALLVNGIAGSGKTSVMLQRIAYLFYQERETLKPDQVYLFGPNDVFKNYIDNVLPSLGEKNPHLFTWRSFCESRGVADRDLGVDTDVSNLHRLEEGLKSYVFTKDDCRDLTFTKTAVYEGMGSQNGKDIDVKVHISASGIYSSAAPLFDKFGLTPRFRTNTGDRLADSLRGRLAEKGRNEDIQWLMRSQNFMGQLPDHLDAEDITPEDEGKMWVYTTKALEVLFEDAFTEIENLRWLRLDRIAMRILGTSTVSASELLYLQMLITERGEFDARFVMIDEVQDYTLTQLTVLARYFRRAHFLMLGDEHQAIREGTATFDQIKELMQEARGGVDECRLLTSYRSSPEITRLFCGLVDMGSEIKLASVQREGVEPEIVALPERESFLVELRKRIDTAAQNKDALCALVAADDGAVSWLAKQLGESVQVIKNGQELPATGVVLMSLRLAKGLEFDEVIIPDGSAETYPDTPIARRRLYTAISRAVHKVSVLAQGELTPLLKKSTGESAVQ